MTTEIVGTADAGSTVDMSHSSIAPSSAAVDNRRKQDRRQRTLYSLFYGSFNPRRRRPRRDARAALDDLDWHPPHWLAVAMLITLLSCVDAALTLTLLEHGAYEVNPLMAPFVNGSPLLFTLVKVGMTAGGVVLLTVAARMKAFGRVPISFVLYGILVSYGCLVVYELKLLEEILLT